MAVEKGWTRNWNQQQRLRAKLTVMRIVLIAPLLVIAAQLVRLQVFEHRSSADRAVNQSVRIVPMPPLRGEIRDRNNQPIVQNSPLFQLWATSNVLSDRDERTLLEAALEVSTPELRQIFRDNRMRRIGNQTLIEDNLPFAAAAKLLARKSDLKYSKVQTTFQRRYEDGSIAAHLLGYVAEASSEDLKGDGFRYTSGDRIGKNGVEKTFNTDLFGHPGHQVIRVDARGRQLAVESTVAPDHGKPVTLTIDLTLQQTAQSLLAGKVGAIIAINPHSGAILASYSEPTMDLNDFRFGVSHKVWQSLLDHPETPLLNRVFQGHYPPGSTYKPFVALAGLAEGIVDPDDTVRCTGAHRVGRRTFRCWKRWGHGIVDLKKSLKESCDVYYYILGQKLGVDTIAEYAKMFGFGSITGPDVLNETSGLVPTTEFKRRRYNQPWLPGETPSVSIGQGFNLQTPAQIARAYAALAVGRLPTLHLRKRTITSTTIDIAPKHFEQVRRGLEAVVSEPHGTGYYARIRDVDVAGKTGTAQVVSNQDADLEFEDTAHDQRDHAWFAGYAPAGDPQIVVVALAEHGGHGGSAAAPMVRAMIETYLETHKASSP